MVKVRYSDSTLPVLTSIRASSIRGNLREISLVSKSENVVFVTCLMSLVFREMDFQILLVSFIATWNNYAGEYGIPFSDYYITACRHNYSIQKHWGKQCQILFILLSPKERAGKKTNVFWFRKSHLSGEEQIGSYFQTCKKPVALVALLVSYLQKLCQLSGKLGYIFLGACHFCILETVELAPLSISQKVVSNLRA